MTPTKTQENDSSNERTQANPVNKTDELILPSKTEGLYFDIANSVHGLAKANGITNKNSIDGKKAIIDIFLCEWKIPPTKIKEDCEQQGCFPSPEIK